MSTSKIIRLGLIGAGRMGSFHGQTAARHIPGACLAAIADPTPGQAARLAAELGVQKVYTERAAERLDPIVVDVGDVDIPAPIETQPIGTEELAITGPRRAPLR